MRIESPAFTAANLDGFFMEMLDVERHALVRRLKAAGAQLAAMGPALDAAAAGAGDEWGPREVLAHIAVASQGWGVIAYRVATGKLEEISAEAIAQQRDPLGVVMLERSPAEMVAATLASHAKTLAYLEQAPMSDLTREFRWEFGTQPAQYLFRLPVVSHIEAHVEQLHTMLGMPVPG
jgi:hypothetical protein